MTCMFKKLWLKFLRPFYVSNIFRSISKLIMPFYMVYLLYIWLNLWQIALIWSFRSIVGLLFEIPTWTIADLYWKKISVVLGYILTWISVLLIPFFHSFIWIVIIFCINALAETLFSGADSAWVSDIIEENDDSLMNSYFPWTRSIRNFWTVISWILGTLVAKYLGLDWLWYIFGIWTIISALLLLFAKDGKQWYEEPMEGWMKKDFWLHIKKSFLFILKNKIVLFLFLWITLFYLADEMTWLVRIPYIKSLGFDINNMWLVYSIIGAWGIFAPLIAEKILRVRKNPINIIFGICLWFSILLLVSSISTSIIFIIALFVVYSFIDDILLPIDETVTNRILEKKKRSTLLSIKSMIINLSSIIWWPLAWFILWYISLSQWLFVGAGLILIVWLTYMITWLFQKNEKVD